MDFKDTIKVEENEITKIKRVLDSKKITRENVYELTKNLSKSQIKELVKAYKDESNVIKSQIDNYKNRIISIKRKVGNQ